MNYRNLLEKTDISLTIFDFSAHCLSDGEHGWYDAPKMEFLNGEKQSSVSDRNTEVWI
mgnify:CR=1 FL=1